GGAGLAHSGASPGSGGTGSWRRGLRGQHGPGHALSRPAGPTPGRGDSQARGRSSNVEGASADARAASVGPDEADGVPCGSAVGGSADAGGNQRLGGDAAPVQRHAPLPARPADGTVIHAPGTGPAIPADLITSSFSPARIYPVRA